MSSTFDAGDGIALADLAVGDVVIVDRGLGDLGGRTYATVIEIGERGPRVSGPEIPTATYAAAFSVESITRYSVVVGRDGEGAFHLLDEHPVGRDVLDVINAPGGPPTHRQYLGGGTAAWIRHVEECRGWKSVANRFDGVLDGGDEA